MMKNRKIRNPPLLSPKSPSSSPPYKFSRSPDDRSKQQQHMNGALSPLHTRRGAHGAVAPTPDFAEFDCFIECPKLITVSSEEHCRDIAAAFSDLDRLQVELEQILVHTTDHQKKIDGEITFITTGDYPSDDISCRPMPTYELRTAESFPSCSKQIDPESTTEDPYVAGEVDWLDDVLDVWPPINLPQKFWVFARDYLDPVDEEYLQQWWLNIVQLFPCAGDCDSPPKFFPVTARKSISSDTMPRDYKTSGLSSYSKVESPSSPRRSRSFVSNKPTSSMRAKPSSDSSPPPNKIARYELRASSHSSAKAFPLIGGLINAYFVGKKEASDIHCNGVLPILDKKNMPSKKDSISVNPMRNIEWKVKKEGPESEDSFQVTHLNGFTSEENGVTANCGDLLEMLNYALEDYISRSDEYSEMGRVNHVKEENVKVEEIEELLRKCASGKKQDSEDEVSLTLKKLRVELREKERPWRNIVVRIWHRLLAEYLRTKLEQELDKADQEMFDVYDKYYSEYPRRRPNNEREREECRYALQRRNEAAQAFYGKQYVALGKWRRKR